MMIELSPADFPPFLAQIFEKMSIPGGERGFAIFYQSVHKQECIACGLLGDSAISVSYAGEEFAVKQWKPISLEDFENLCQALPEEAKRSSAIFAEDVLDGESYMVKWVLGNEMTRMVLSNPRHSEDVPIKQLAFQLDDVMKQARKAKTHFPRVKGSEATSSVLGLPTRNRVE